MAEIKFGPIYTALEDIIGPVELAQKAESWGYDSFWVPDYILRPRLEAMSILAAASQKTSRIQLGTAVLVLPYKHPLQLAKTALSVDVLSHGRLQLGVGIGADAREFQVMGLNVKERAAMSDERLDILRRLLTGTSVSHQGKYHQFNNVALGPPPIQKPHIPIWVGAIWRDGIAEGVIRRTAKYADVFVPADIPVQEFKKARKRIEMQAEAENREPDSITWALFLWICLDKSPEAARRKASRELERRLNRGGVQFGKATALGTVQDCIETIGDYVNAGISHVVLDGAAPPQELVEQYQQAAEEIVSQFK